MDNQKLANHELDIPSIDEGKVYSKEVHELVMDVFENDCKYLPANFSNPAQYYCNFFSSMDYTVNPEDRVFNVIFDEDLNHFTARVRFDARRWIEDYERCECIKNNVAKEVK